jgi:hypothetical protein
MAPEDNDANNLICGIPRSRFCSTKSVVATDIHQSRKTVSVTVRVTVIDGVKKLECFMNNFIRRITKLKKLERFMNNFIPCITKLK